MSISLPDKPNGYQFEEGVSARIRSIGYFTENRTILDHAGREVLELDIVASPASDKFLKKILIDAKKDTAGFADIFKVYGWKKFLDISTGYIVHGSAADEQALAAFGEICPKLDVHADHFSLTAGHHLKNIPVINIDAPKDLQDIVYCVGWYQLIADRLAVEDYHKIRKQNIEDPIFYRVRKYRRACSLAFFEKNPLIRVKLLYSAFQEDPGISGACVEWQALRSKKDVKDIWESVRDSAEYPWIQHVMTLEARARILIIKNGIEAAILGHACAGNLDTFWAEYDTIHLPENFKTGFEKACVNPNRSKIPYILQLYLEIFGGFLIDETDKTQLATLSNAPIDLIDESLALFNTFYPTINGWITTSKEIKMMKMIPAYIRGTGAFQRNLSRKLTTYNKLCPSMAFLISKWHNSIYKILSPELEKKEAI